jgi:hypothetical protein
MQQPSSSERYITIIDNKGREKVEFVEYLVEDVRGEKSTLPVMDLPIRKIRWRAKDKTMYSTFSTRFRLSCQIPQL